MKYEISDDFIGIFEDVYPDKLCQDYIDYFETWTQNYHSYDRDDGMRIKDSSIDTMIGNFYEENLKCEYINKPFIDKFFELPYRKYVNHFKELREIPQQAIFDIKIQKTTPGQGYHIWHCEKSNLETRNRICVFAMYLNDVEEGGETEFLYQSRRVKPKRGRLAIWPAQFTHMHRGNQPLSGDKYIITGWVEYGAWTNT